jgi:hypothetical protein
MPTAQDDCAKKQEAGCRQLTVDWVEIWRRKSDAILINEDLCERLHALRPVLSGDIIYRLLDPAENTGDKIKGRMLVLRQCEEYCPTDAVKIVFPQEMLHSETQWRRVFFGKPARSRR